MPVRKSKSPRNASASTYRPTLEEFLRDRGVNSLAEIDARRERIPSSVVEMSAEERKLLKDPDWIDEDEAAAVLAIRYYKTLSPGDYTDIRKYIRSRGRDIAD